ncbi:hypothetical protein F8568_038845 [Actinomadura sp. LD22]|uniref:Uncharacterized protein n=1 Tax=Actinomadura physcomitrii TaxID=2650748 RepID=A0A6I4MJ39_9ACTN|nr:hypothetical protein [Actinomadura physcomitrii]MWA06208.1 hypothetical protein [Actinomadura physcomitrii]
MAESSPRPGAPGAVPGDEPGRQQVVEDGGPPGGFTAAPAPWGDSPPWWSAGADGTGPQMIANGTGPQPVAGGTGGHRLPVPANGTGGHPLPGGTGGHPLPGGTGGHPLPGGTGGRPLPNGTGPIVLPNGTGPHALPAPLGAAPPGAAEPPRERRNVSGLLLGAAIGAALVAVLLVGVLAFKPGGSGAGKGRKTAGPGPAASTRKINAVPRAGGMAREAIEPAASAAYPFVMAAVQAAGVPAAKNGTAVYAEPVGRTNVLFVGGTGAVGDPAAFLRKLRPSTFISGEQGNPGQNGGRAECGTFAVLAETHTYCAWATRDSYGVVASDVATRNPDFSLMDDVMRRIRKDVEKPAR